MASRSSRSIGPRSPSSSSPTRPSTTRPSPASCCRAPTSRGSQPRRTSARMRAAERRLPWALALAALLVAAFLLRIWGVRQGLPYAYNSDENAHFVPKAIQLFGHGWNPHYFVNPPAYTYVLHVVFAGWFGGRAGVSEQFATD